MPLMMRRATLCCGLAVVALVATFFAGLTPRLAVAANAKPATARSSSSPERPFTIVALASANRLREQTAHIAHAAGQPQLAETLFSRISMGLEALLKLDGLDPSRPIGVLTYPRIFREIAADDGSGDSQPSVPAFKLPDPLNFEEVLEFLAGEPVIFFPVQDAERFMAALARVANDQFLPVPGKPGFFQNEKGEEQPVRLVGKYLLYCSDARHTRDFPDLDKLLRPLLANRDFVVSIQAQGVPHKLRKASGDAVQSMMDAALQRYDGESDLAFRWRTALGAFQHELLDLLISHIDEINLGVRLDPMRSEATFDLDVVGPKDGKLAKLCNGLPGKRSLLAGLANDEGPLSLALSCAFSPRLTKPLVEALRTRADFGLDGSDPDLAIASLGVLFRTLADTIEAGQLDAIVTTRGIAEDRVGLLGLRVAGSSGLVEAVQQILEQHRHLFETKVISAIDADDKLTFTAEERPWNLAADSLDDRPIHRVPFIVVHELFGGWIDDLALPLPRTGSLWVAATPQSLWFAWSNDGAGTSAPQGLKEAMQSLLQPVSGGSASSRQPAPFQLTLHTQDWPSARERDSNLESKDVKVRRQALIQQNDQLREKAIVEKAFRDRADALRCEVRPTTQGLRVRVVLEEAYVAWYGLMLTDSAEEDEATGSESSGN